MISHLENVQHISIDVLVVGSGGAGCRAAIAAHDNRARVVLATSSGLTGRASTFYPFEPDMGYSFGANAGGVEQHYQAILAASEGMADLGLAWILAEEAPRRLRELLAWGFPMKRAEAVVRADFGPAELRVATIDTRKMSRNFKRQIRTRGIEELSHHILIRLLSHDGECTGGLFLNRAGQPVVVQAKSTILATGGPNNVFLRHKNPPGLEGVGHAQALALGADLINIEFYQVCFLMAGPIAGMNFSPYFLKVLPRLTNDRGEEFLSRYLPADVSPERCIWERAQNAPFRSQGVAKHFDVAVVSEINAGRGSPGGAVWVDFTHLPRQEIRNTQPHYFDWLVAAGVDLTLEPVEVLVAPHAFNGGVRIDAEATTKVPGLFACGEIAGGPHGANRIGGNSIAGTQVFGARAGRFAAGRAQRMKTAAVTDKTQVQAELQQIGRYLESRQNVAPTMAQQAMQEAMWEEMVVFKDTTSLTRLLQRLDSIKKELLPHITANTPAQLHQCATLPAQLRISEIIARVALAREESRGPHYRTDYPKRDDNGFGQPIVVSQVGEAPLIHS